MFEDDYRAVNDALAPSREAEQRTLEAMRRSANTEKRTPSRMSVGLRAAVAACLCLLMVAPAVIGVKALVSRNGQSGHSASNIEYGSAGTSIKHEAVVVPQDYAEVFEWLRPSLANSSDVKNGGEMIWFYEGVLAPVSDASGILDYAAEVEHSPQDHSDTNVQVEGVDESDIIKTDGRYIYVLNNEGVAVLAADGADTYTAAHIKESAMPRHNEDCNRSFSGMYLADGKLIVISREYKYFPYWGVIDDYIAEPSSEDDEDDIIAGGDDNDETSAEDCYYCWNWGSGDTVVYVFDVEDPEKPQLISTLCMEGSYLDSRLTDGTLYLISNYYPESKVYPNDPTTFVPACFNNDGECVLTPAQDISLVGDGKNYTYVASVSMSDPDEFSDTLALLGSADITYCSANSLYLVMTDYDEETKPIRFFYDEDNGYCTIDDNGDIEGELETWCEKSNICRVSLTGGSPKLAAQGSIMGSCLNQFSLDEYNGYLRVAASYNVWSCITQKAEDGGEIGYGYDADDREDNCVYVLDSELNTVGRLEGLASDELIKSVRFMGDIGYVVTFRQTDPLFSIDLSDPNAPRVIGKLKIPGFSEYLHYWGDGQLFGFGQMADTETGGVEGIKLSMFDISDPVNVNERACLHISDIDYSAAEYDHKAILVAPERGLIGFPAESDSYVIYSYGDDGFAEKARIKFDFTDWYGDLGKGLYIGSDFYVINASGAAYVIDLDTFELSATVKF